MALPSFTSLAARRRQRKKSQGVAGPEQDSERTVTPTSTPAVDIKRATATRNSFVIISSVLYAISVIFLILTIIGNINDKPVIRGTYFYKLDLTNIIPSSAENIVLVNSLARSLGLHDFYQVGLWNFCEGYNDEGITYCSPTRSLYWFNPVEVLLNELLSGATIALPAEITKILALIRIASRIMFGFFLTGICMNTISIGFVFLALKSRWWSFALAVWTFLAGLFVVAATVIGTAMALIFENVATSQESLNIGAAYGKTMFAFMWIAAACSLFGFIIHVSMTCCCASRRDIRTGRRKGRASAYEDTGADEKRPSGKVQWKVPTWGKEKSEGECV
ncbi:hypothetical protein QTJ16_005495 [Diplocarpon rosae]|uniref:Integral membrane protein n=1 Tax=Diplocarpon rosae TaxID=946125 RepID=A0AAD9WD71_9HELO|nr:hypothetical protein QTJ16_005495 [Diplocarpon rosae]PBP22286.1 putative integral membrane protein [Diplocarpon rosae]